jgi:hypothetical protein
MRERDGESENNKGTLQAYMEKSQWNSIVQLIKMLN